jgi:CheY-like chemotaxis protein
MTRHAKRVTILVADDDPDDRLLIRKAFEAAGLRANLRFVRDGEELMDYLKRRGRYADPKASPQPALLLLDLSMPKKGGLEALREIKTDSALRQIRDVVLSTSQQEEDVARAYDSSAASFIAKPPKFADLVEVVRALGKYWLELVELPQTDDGR